jgi:GMP synthase (glutamine-hydrolysing)
MALRLLVVEGNARSEREAQQIAYGKSASESYALRLQEIAPDAVCDICYPADPGATTPDSDGLAGYDGIAITGSALNLYDGGPAISGQINFARAAFASRTPMFGSCWGLQVAAAATGGQALRNPRGREIGFARNIARTAAGASHPLLIGRPPAYDAPCVHLDIVALPPTDAECLASNALAPVQAAEIRHAGGVFWGVQYHPEYSLDHIASIIERRSEVLTAEGFFRDAGDCDRYCADLRLLAVEAGRIDVAWRLGLGADVTDKRNRETELRNFVDALVRPEKSRRGRM